MPTTVHIPDPFAEGGGPSREGARHQPESSRRSRLEQAIRERSGWTPEFLERLRRVDSETSAAADELLNAVKQARRSKEPHEL